MTKPEPVCRCGWDGVGDHPCHYGGTVACDDHWAQTQGDRQ